MIPIIYQYKTTGQDWFNYISQGCTSNALIQYVMKVKGKINYPILEKAIRLSFDAEPILGCRFMEQDPCPTWETINNLEIYPLCPLITTDNAQQEIDKFLASELWVDKSPQLKACVIRDEKEDTICLKLNHAACDGAGAKYYLRLLEEIYRKIEANEIYIPPVREGKRTTQEFYKALNITNLKDTFQPGRAELPSTWGFPTDENKDKPQRFTYEICRLEEQDFKALYKYSKNRGITINNIILSAYYLAMLNLVEIKEGLKEIQFMIDLRKYLPSGITQTICNLSAIVNIELPVIEDNDLEKMVSITAEEMKKVMSEKPYIHSTIGGDLATAEGFYNVRDFINNDWEKIKISGKCTPMISNLGQLTPQLLEFGTALIQDVYVVTPAFYAPAFMLGLSTYNDRLTLCASYYTPGIAREKVKLLLDDMCKMLKELV